MIAALAQAAGLAGMAGGQAIDIESTGSVLTLEQLEHMHRLKTGAPIGASVVLGALSAPELPARQVGHQRFAECAGPPSRCRMTSDVEGDAATLGKSPGQTRLATSNVSEYRRIESRQTAHARAARAGAGGARPFGAAAEPCAGFRYIIERRC
jgi:geranylgeranyl pyrophosphate synthase